MMVQSYIIFWNNNRYKSKKCRNKVLLQLFVGSMPIFRWRRMKVFAEAVVEIGAGGEAAERGYEGDAVGGGDKEAGSMFYAVAVDETVGAGAVGAGADSLFDVAVVGVE